MVHSIRVSLIELKTKPCDKLMPFSSHYPTFYSGKSAQAQKIHKNASIMTYINENTF